MPIEDRIIYDAAALVREVENDLDSLKRFQYDDKYHMLLGNDFIARLADWDKQIRARKDDPFTLVVCGDFKRGKSTLINALLGQEVVTTNVTTETVTLNRISYGSHTNEAFLSGGRKLVLADEEMQRENLQAIMKEAGEHINLLEIRRPLEILKNITIIDTPGLGDAFKDYSDMVGEALAQADAVIYVFSVSYPLSLQEQMFLKTAILPQKYTELFLVGNFADAMPGEQDLSRVGELLDKRIYGLLPGQTFYLVSALDERCRQLGEERPNEGMKELLEQHFDEFRQKVEQMVEDKQNYVLPDRMERLLGMMKSDLESGLSAMEKGLSMDEQGIHEAMLHLEEEKEKQIGVQADAENMLAGLVLGMKADALGWMNELTARMEAEVDRLSGMDATILTKYYSFYCVDTMQQALDRCLERHQEELYDALEDISYQLVRGLGSLKEQQPYQFRFSLDNKTWTKGDNVSYVVNRVIGTSLFSLVADGFAGAMREKEVANRTPEVLKKIHMQYASVSASVQKMVEKTYSDMEIQVKKQLQSYYRDQIAKVEAEVEQSARVAGQSAENKKAVEAAVREIRETLGRIGNIS